MKSNMVIRIFLLLVIVTGCDENKKAAAVGSTADVDNEQAYIEKYNLYIAVWNKTVPSVEEAYNQYLSLFNRETGEPLEKREKYYLRTPYFTNAIVNLKKGIDAEPEMENVDKIGKNMIMAFENFEKPFTKIAEYLELQNHVDDDFQKVKEMHSTISENMEMFLQESTKLGEQIKIMSDEFRRKELVEFKEQGLMIRYNHALLLNGIGEHSALLHGIDYNNYDKIDLEQYDAKLKDITTAYDAFKEGAEDAQQFGKEFSQPHILMMFKRAVDDYIVKARNLQSLAKDPKELAKKIDLKERMNMSFGFATPETLYKAYDKVIYESNLMN